MSRLLSRSRSRLFLQNQDLRTKTTFLETKTQSLKITSLLWWLILNTNTVRVSQKDIIVYLCLYVRQMLTDFQNSFTGRHTSKFAVKL